MDPQEELQQLLDRQESLTQELKAKKKELLEAQRLRKETLKRQIQRAKSRITARERKLRTRRLILMGSYLEHVTQDDPERKARLMKELDGFLERDRDRELFDLNPKEVSKGRNNPSERQLDATDYLKTPEARSRLDWVREQVTLKMGTKDPEALEKAIAREQSAMVEELIHETNLPDEYLSPGELEERRERETHMGPPPEAGD